MAMDKAETIEEVKRAAEAVTLKRHEEMVAQEEAAAENGGTYANVEAQKVDLQAASDAAVENDTTTEEVSDNSGSSSKKTSK